MLPSFHNFDVPGCKGMKNHDLDYEFFAFSKELSTDNFSFQLQYCLVDVI